MARCTILDAVMSKPIRMPGFPQIIVTRGWAYQYFKELGWSDSERGFASLDYMIFGATSYKVCHEPLTDTETRDYYLQHPRIREDFSR